MLLNYASVAFLSFAGAVSARVFMGRVLAARLFLLSIATSVAFYNPVFVLGESSRLYLSVLLLYAGTAALLLPRDGKLPIPRGLAFLIYALVLCIPLSVLLNNAQWSAILRSALLWGQPLAGFIIAFCGIRQDTTHLTTVFRLWRILVIIAAAGTVAVLVSYFYLALPWIQLREASLDPGIGRFAGVGAGFNPNPFADYAMIELFATLGLVSMIKHRFERVLLWATVILFAIALLMTGSRGAILGLLSGLIVLLATRTRSANVRKNVIVAVAVLSIGIGVAAMVSMRIREMAEVLSYRYSAAASSFFREPFSLRPAYIPYMNAFAQSPLWGRGLGWFAEEPSLPRSAHNIVLQMLSEGGIIGLAVLLAVLLAVGCRYMRVVKNHGSERLSSLWLVFGAALAGMLIHGLFENTVTQIQTGWLIGALLGLIWKRYQTVG